MLHFKKSPDKIFADFGFYFICVVIKYLYVHYCDLLQCLSKTPLTMLPQYFTSAKWYLFIVV